MADTGDLLNGRYLIKKVLRRGGMGRVYLAQDMSFQGIVHEVAVKENLRSDKDQFIREAAVLAKLKHAGLPKVTDHFFEEDSQFLVMEYVAGMDLEEDVDRDGKFSEDEAASVGIRVCGILEYLHSQSPPVIHRDIKPANLKWDQVSPDAPPERRRKEAIVLIDFGIAKTWETTETRPDQRGISKGYSPLEQMGGARHTTEVSDVYSLGSSLFKLATAVQPPIATDRVIEDTVDGPLSDVDPALASVIKKAMAVYPEKRYQSAREFRNALERLVTEKPFVLEDASVKEGDVVLRWTKSDDADTEAFDVHASLEADFTPSDATLAKKVTQPDATTTTLKLPPDADHHVKVRLVSRSGASRISNELAVHVPLPAPTPSKLSPLAPRPRALILRWSSPPDPSHFQKYEVHHARVPGFTISEATLLESISSPSETKAVARGLEPGASYYFKVRTVNVDGQDAISNEQAGQAKQAFRIEPRLVVVFFVALLLGAFLISAWSPKTGPELVQNVVTKMPWVREWRRSRGVVSRDEQRLIVIGGQDPSPAAADTIRTEIVMRKQEEKEHVLEEVISELEIPCGEEFHVHWEGLDWEDYMVDDGNRQVLGDLCKPMISATKDGDSTARISWTWEGSAESFGSYRIFVGKDEGSLWTANLAMEILEFDQKQVDIDLSCGTNLVGLRILSPDGRSVDSDVLRVSGPDCPPGAPQLLSVTPGTNGTRELVIRWSWSESEPRPGVFVVESMLGDSPYGSWQSQNVDGSSDFVTIGNLLCDREYVLRVRAMTSGGVLSAPSDTMHGSTERCIVPPPAPPTHLVFARGEGVSSAKVGWEWSGTPASLIGFRVEVLGAPDLGGDVDRDDRGIEVHGLECNLECQIRVIALGPEGQTAPSEWYAYDHRCSLAPPTAVRVDPGGPTGSLVVSWDYGDAPLLEHFLVQCTDPQITTAQVPGSRRERLFTGLARNKEYGFRVKAVAAQTDLSSEYTSYVYGSTGGGGGGHGGLPQILNVPGDRFATLTEAIQAVNLDNDVQEPVTLRLQAYTTYTVTETMRPTTALWFGKSTIIEGNDATIQISASAEHGFGMEQPGKTLTLRRVRLDAGQLQPIQVSQGKVILEGCRVETRHRNCAVVYSGGELVVGHGSKLICDTSQPNARSVFIEDSGASAQLIGCDVNQTIEARDGAKLTLRNVRVLGARGSGVIFRNGAWGEIVGGEIRDNGLFGVTLEACGKVRIARCRIENNRQEGINCEDVDPHNLTIEVNTTRYGCP